MRINSPFVGLTIDECRLIHSRHAEKTGVPKELWKCFPNK